MKHLKLSKMVRAGLRLSTALVLSPLQAQEANVILQSTVSGSRELPRVMYILPWQQPGAVQLDYPLQDELAQELFVPIDRDEFVRSLVYHTRLKSQTGSGNAVSEAVQTLRE